MLLVSASASDILNVYAPVQDRLPFLDTGIMDILTRTTGGVGIVLEHRYYGANWFFFRRTT